MQTSSVLVAGYAGRRWFWAWDCRPGHGMDFFSVPTTQACLLQQAQVHRRARASGPARQLSAGRQGQEHALVSPEGCGPPPPQPWYRLRGGTGLQPAPSRDPAPAQPLTKEQTQALYRLLAANHRGLKLPHRAVGRLDRTAEPSAGTWQRPRTCGPLPSSLTCASRPAWSSG